MTLPDFHNNLRILMNIDKHEFIAAGGGDEDWLRFRDNPHRFFIICSDALAAGLWAIIEKRQPKRGPDRVVVLEDLLDRCAEFLDGQVDVVDGDYGQPEPNKAMRLVSEIREVVPA